MDKWLKADGRFPHRCSIFTLPRGRSETAAMWEAVLGKSEFPAVEEAAYALVLLERPELSGCVVWYYNFDGARNCWEFGVCHGTLPPVEFGEEISRVPLRKSDPLPTGRV